MKHYAHQYYHVYNRVVNRQPIFATVENYHFLLRRVKEFLPFYTIRVVAYALMPNHYHFIFAVDENDSLSPFLQRLFNIRRPIIASKNGQGHYSKADQKAY